MDEIYNKHYIKTRADGAIIDAFSDGPHNGRPTDGYICFGQGSYQFRLFPNGEENPSIFDADGIPLYKWDGQAVQVRTEAEIAAERAAIPAPPPSEMERLRADIDFLAAMGGLAL